MSNKREAKRETKLDMINRVGSGEKQSEMAIKKTRFPYSTDATIVSQ
jgi:hypothetical protein